MLMTTSIKNTKTIDGLEMKCYSIIITTTIIVVYIMTS